MSRQSVSRRLNKGGCSHYDLLFVCLCPQCTSESGRLHWASEHRSSTPEHWGHVLFTDESRFNIQYDSRRAVIWREPGTRYQAPNIVERPLQRWRVTCLGRDSNERPNRPLHVRWGLRHGEDILHPLVRPFFAAIGTDAIFMDDKTRPHKALLVRRYLESETIPQMAWPVRSPELNPREYVWNMFGRRIAGHSVPIGTFHELQQALLQE
ncbi:hypothetical protein AVEN_175197-1 [Araneus ventricosus]|uniref:Tc1-like transposase DDE domain-containing protein n=1 Tax=Araneus ventricosus TaxID=182803 RepID=A0A4Y2HHB1_ARAVE|nr:hypothetical protein AVEN_175197-1 [Araneus ventricosus]